MSKRVKEAMGLLVQSTMDETLILTSKRTSFMLGLEKITKWINLIQVLDEEAKQVSYAVALLTMACDLMQ